MPIKETELPLEGKGSRRRSIANASALAPSALKALALSKTVPVNIVEVEGIGELVYVRASYRLQMSMTMEGDEVTVEQKGHVNILRRDEGGDWRIYRQIYNRDHPPVVPEGGPGS